MQGVIAQNTFSLNNTIWEYRWENDHRDFIAFLGANRAICYSYEIDNFEFCEYSIKNDTIIISTNDIFYAGKYSENPIDSIVYNYKIDKNNKCLYLLCAFCLRKYGNEWERLNIDETYKLCIKKNNEE